MKNIRMGRCRVQLIVIFSMIISTSTRPIPKSVPVQCGEFTCNIMREYCYQNQCQRCNRDVCNTLDYTDGTLSQCFYYCERFQTSTSPAPSFANDTSYLAEDGHPTERNTTDEIKLGINVLLAIILGSFFLGAFSLMLLMWCRNRRNKNNPNNKGASPISSPQDKYSGSTNPLENCKMLVSAADHSELVIPE